MADETKTKPKNSDINVKIETDGVPDTFQIHKFRDFKINGLIGNPGQKDKLSYSSLSYQMQNGRERGFSEKEICSAVIRAITPGNTLRTYLECRECLDLKTLIKILRSHFKEKDSTSVFTELSNAVQMGQENELEFCLRLMGLRQKVLILSKEEDCPYEKKLVQTRFEHALLTGLKNNNIRYELKTVLRGGTFEDEELLQELSQLMVNETEHFEKIHSKSKVVSVDAIEIDQKLVSKQKGAEKQIYSPKLLN